MKRILLLASLALPVLTHAQGVLTPPSTPAPSMRSLDQVEPRRPLQAGVWGVAANGAGFIISQPGSYYLTADIAVGDGDAILIKADSVTLDLNGFILVSDNEARTGIAIRIDDSHHSITIRNGHIKGSVTVTDNGDYTCTIGGAGFAHGISSTNGYISNCTISDITVQGVAGDGIAVSWPSTVTRCTVTSCGAYGIIASTVSNCAADTCGNNGIDGITVRNCRGKGIRYGISADVATNCYGTSSMGTGVAVSSTASFCRGGTGNPANYAITAGLAIACTSENGPISVHMPNGKQLGTP